MTPGRGRRTAVPAAPSPSEVPEVDDHPLVRETRELCAHGDAAAAVRRAYPWALAETIRSFGLMVPESLTHRAVLREFLREDMGRLCELLPRLYDLYEPARFGGSMTEGPDTVVALVRQLCAETPLARAFHPLFQTRGPRPDDLPARRTDGPLGRSGGR